MVRVNSYGEYELLLVSRTVYGEEHVARNCRQPLGSESGLQLMAFKELSPVIQPQGYELCPQPEWAWEWVLQIKKQPGQTLTAACWELVQKTQWSRAWTSDPQELWASKHVLF